MRPILRRWPAVLLLLSVPAATAAGPTVFAPATPESQGLDPAALKSLAESIRGYVEQDTVVGAELAVIKNRRLVFHEAFGMRDREDGVAWEKNTLCNIRSMSKCLTGAAAQVLIDQQKLGLDDPVARYLPSFDNDKSGAITVEHLLTHRSGLPLTMLEEMYGEYGSLREIADLAGARGPDFEPGTDFQYSDTGSDVLGAVIEVVAGRPLEAFVRETLLDPLGMDDTLVYHDPEDPHRERVPPLYVGAPHNWIRFWTPEDDPFYPFEAGSQSLYSTPLDYARFLAMCMDGGRLGDTRVLSSEAVARMLTPVSEMPLPVGFPDADVRYGQMMILYADASSGRLTAFGHNGSDGTWATAWPDRDLMVLYFTQSRGQATGTRLEAQIDRLLLHPEREGEAAVAEVAAEYAPYLGVYVANFVQHNNEEFTVKVVNGHLAVDVPSQIVYELRDPDENGRWLFALTDQVAVTFERDDAGTVDCMVISQGGMTFHVPRKGSARAAALAAARVVRKADVEDLIGTYYHPERETNVHVVWKDDRLWLIVPGLPDLELMPPDADGRRALRLQPNVGLSFERGDDGTIVSMTRWVGDESLVMPRLEVDLEAPVPDET
jgi:CubicO group peptidase (beta-lactamase class C family)